MQNVQALRTTRIVLPVLACIFVILNTLDIALTCAVVLNNGGIELNPIMAYILQQPLATVLLYKIGGSTLIVIAVLLLPERFTCMKLRVLRTVDLIMVGIVLFNLVGLVL